MTFDSRHDPAHLYFVTATVCGWKHLFIEPVYADIVLGSLDWLRREGRMTHSCFNSSTNSGATNATSTASGRIFRPSACFYDRGETPVIDIDDVRQWL